MDAETLVRGWIGHFQSADRVIKWEWAEREVEVWLDPHTLLLGRMDAGGVSGSEVFWGEWKSANPREKKTWKQVWRMNPQSLTYGVLARAIWPDCERFTVRKAFKEMSGVPTYDHAWFRYSKAELSLWENELINLANEIREYRVARNRWPLNLNHCFEFGVNYACPFFEPACSKLDWDAKPGNAIVRISHLDSERRLYEGMGGATALSPKLVVLDATRVKTWLGCRQRFRREYEDNVTVPPGEALKLGIDFHELLGVYYSKLAKGEL